MPMPVAIVRQDIKISVITDFLTLNYYWRVCDMWHERAANAIPAKAHDLLTNHERGEVKVSGELLVLSIYQNQLFRALSSTVLRASLINWYIRFNSLGAYISIKVFLRG